MAIPAEIRRKAVLEAVADMNNRGLPATNTRIARRLGGCVTAAIRCLWQSGHLSRRYSEVAGEMEYFVDRWEGLAVRKIKDGQARGYHEKWNL